MTAQGEQIGSGGEIRAGQEGFQKPWDVLMRLTATHPDLVQYGGSIVGDTVPTPPDTLEKATFLEALKGYAQANGVTLEEAALDVTDESGFRDAGLAG